MQFDNSVTLALSARSKAHAYSKSPVGAAVECKSEAIFENRSLGLAICAERVAVGAAAGERDFVAIAMRSDSDEPMGSCGACRQFLAEFNPDLTIVSARPCAVTERWIVFRVFFPTGPAEF
jgi:cytidine deaminase